MDIAFVAGEASGDRYGAALLAAMRRQMSTTANDRQRDEPGEGEADLAAWGIGGVLMQDAGVRLMFDSRTWGAIGVVESLAKVPPLLVALSKIKKALSRRPPDALILIDFGAFNIRLGRWVKSRALCPVFYFVPPGSWRRRASAKRLLNLAGAADLFITPFAWSEPLLADAGMDAHFLGHPLLDLVQVQLPASEFDSRFGLDPHRAVIALMPGSRTQELEHILPTLLSAAADIAARVPGAQFLLPLAPNVSRSTLEEMLERDQTRVWLAVHGGEIVRKALTTALKAPPLAPIPRLATAEGLLIDPKIAREREKDGEPWKQVMPNPPAQGVPLALVEGLTYDALSRADLILAASGTATLEAAILKKPMIIVYRGSKLMEAEWRILRKSLDIEYIGLPNILARQRICPEYIQEEATPKAISDKAVEMLLQPEHLLKTKEKLAQVVSEYLGQPGATDRAAKMILDRIIAANAGRQ